MQDAVLFVYREPRAVVWLNFLFDYRNSKCVVAEGDLESFVFLELVAEKRNGLFSDLRLESLRLEPDSELRHVVFEAGAFQSELHVPVSESFERGGWAG